jgi:hypothetical protein
MTVTAVIRRRARESYRRSRRHGVRRTLREMPPEPRRQAVRPIVDAVFERVDEMKASTLPEEPLRKAIGYVANQRVALQTFLDNGRLESDNNTAENAI